MYPKAMSKLYCVSFAIFITINNAVLSWPSPSLFFLLHQLAAMSSTASSSSSSQSLFYVLISNIFERRTYKQWPLDLPWTQFNTITRETRQNWFRLVSNSTLSLIWYYLLPKRPSEFIHQSGLFCADTHPPFAGPRLSAKGLRQRRAAGICSLSH